MTEMEKSDQTKAFLRWAGGKSWLARRQEGLFGPLSFQRYHEPFLGGGSFFFSVAAEKSAYLSDLNSELIDTYITIRDSCDDVIRFMRSMKNERSEYYKIRSQNPSCEIEKAARFIYLNQTSFNGIYRVNLNGVYNVPFGNRSKPFLDEAALRNASSALSKAILRSCDFFDTISDIRRGDLVFIDPPYTVSHNNNGFIKYNQSLFSLNDQYRLADFIRAIKDIGAYYILTNAAHDSIREIFELGDRRLEVTRASLIGGKQAHRGSVSEYLFTNIGGD